MKYDTNTRTLACSDKNLQAVDIMAQVLPMINQNMDILHLDIQQNMICSDGISLVANFLNEKCIPLQSLNLSGNLMGSCCMESIGIYVHNNTELTTLNLSNTNIGSKGVRTLCNYLYNHPSLSFINVSNCKMDDAAAVDLLIVLASCPKMQHLYIRDNRFAYINLVEELLNMMELYFSVHC